MLDLIFDTETTDLITNSLRSLDKQPYVIEFYGMLIDRDSMEIVSDYETLCDVPVKITEKISKITNITNEMVSDSPAFKSILNEIRSLIEQADRVVAHNLAFDCEMLEIEFKRANEALTWPEKLCTVETTEYIKGYRMSLTELHEYLFGEKFKGAHRARDDVEALFRCYKRLIEDKLI